MNDYVTIKVPASVHRIIKWLAFQKGKHIYELISELVYYEISNEKNGDKK